MKDNFEGIKSFYDGYYKAFYKVNKSDENLEKCMNDETISNMLSMGQILENPISLFEMKNLKDDLNLFGEIAEVSGDLSACHFEASFYDIWNMCSENKELCAMGAITSNLTKNMFVLMGKLTSLAETLKGFPSKEEDVYNEQMRELGSDAGTFLRVVYNFETPEHK